VYAQGNVKILHNASGEGGFAQTARVPSYRGGSLAKLSNNFYSGWKSL